MIRTMIRTITEKHHLNAITLGEFAHMKVKGTDIIIWAFHADGLGHVSAMTARGLLGLVQTDTLIITPTERDMPLFSCDRVRARGNDTLNCVLFDTLLEPAALEAIEALKACFPDSLEPETDTGWYDAGKLPQSLSRRGKKADRESFDRCALEYLKAFLEDAEKAPYCDPAAKKEKASVHVEGLLSNGGPCTDGFKKGIGDERTETLFRNVLFGTGR